MSSNTQNSEVSKTRLRISLIIRAILVLFILFDAITKLMMVPQVIDATKRLGYPFNLIPIIAIILLICTLLYIIPRTSILGAILLTGYMGGAVASNLRIENPLFSNTLFPVYFGILIWAALYLRDKRLSNFIPFNKENNSL